MSTETIAPKHPDRAAPTSEDQNRWRTYLFELEGVEPWAVVPLVKRVRELVEFHSDGDLEYEYDTEVEVQIRFKTVERTEEPKYGLPWGKVLDEELMLGSGWRCIRTTFADGSTIDETEAAAQRARTRAANREKS